MYKVLHPKVFFTRSDTLPACLYESGNHFSNKRSTVEVKGQGLVASQEIAEIVFPLGGGGGVLMPSI